MLTRTRKAFTLLELIVVIVILGILALLAIPTFASVISKSHYSGLEESGRALDHDATAIAAFSSAAASGNSTAISGAKDEMPSNVTVTVNSTNTKATVADQSGYSVCVVFGTGVNAYGSVTDGACS